MLIDIQEEKKKLLRSYRALLRKAKPVLKSGDAWRIREAFVFSMKAHENMRRKSGELYIFHPLAVAQICVSEIGLGTTSIIAALIHDIVEDTDIELSTIEQKFGKKIVDITDGLTKIRGFFDYGTSAQAENFHKMIIALSKDMRVILIKLADRLHNMRTMESMPREKQIKISSETIYLYAPLAHRLGLNAIKTELEDLYLKFAAEEAYSKIVAKMDKSRGSRNKFIREFVSPVKVALDASQIEYNIKGRPKSIYSIWKKMNRKKIPFEEVYDLFAIRIIVESSLDKEKSQCWHVYSMITDYYTPNPDRLRDWISVPKANGYESLHTTVMAKNGQWVEVQIRTQRMNEIAEKGYAAHWKYKNNSVGNESNLDKWLNHVRELLESQDLSALEFVDDFKRDLFQKEVFVFTPMGELKTLPQGATALDFAYSIHSDVGNHCVGAKINQKLSPIGQALKSGDQVEILTTSTFKARKGWLRYVITSRAKSKIKEAIKDEKRPLAEEGKKLLLKKIKDADIVLDKWFDNRAKTQFKTPSFFDFCYKVGKGSISIRQVKQFYTALSTINEKESKILEHAMPHHQTKISATPQNVLLIGDDMDFLDYVLAKCCTPIPGDEVFGFATISEGIKIHRVQCPNAPKLLSSYGHRIIKARWSQDHESDFLAELNVIGVDRMGLINDLSKVISKQLRVNMNSFEFKTENEIFTGHVKLYVNDKEHLDLLIDNLRDVDGVVSVSRFDQ